MAKSNKTMKFEQYLKQYLSNQRQGVFACPEVTIGWFGNERVDYLAYTTNDWFKCYEIKVTKQDFYSKCHKSFIGNYNYYVMPRDLYYQIQKDIPKGVGVLVENKIGDKIYSSSPLRAIRTAKKQELKVDKDILKNSLIRSLYRESGLSDREKLNNKIKLLEKNKKDNDTYIKELEYALFDMINQFSYSSNNKLHTGRLSALKNAFEVLNINEEITTERLQILMKWRKS